VVFRARLERRISGHRANALSGREDGRRVAPQRQGFRRLRAAARAGRERGADRGQRNHGRMQTGAHAGPDHGGGNDAGTIR